MRARWSERAREIKFREAFLAAKLRRNIYVQARWSERAGEIKFREARRAAKLRRNINASEVERESARD